MARQKRIDFPGAVHHVFSRGNVKADIYLDDYDRLFFLDLLERVVKEYDWLCGVYALMGNHYHLFIKTLEANLAESMQYLNGQYARMINKKYARVGHLFQGRYGSALVEQPEHYLNVPVYIVLNPVKDGFAEHVGDCRWTCYRAMIGEAPVPKFLSPEWVLSFYSSQPNRSVETFKNIVCETAKEKFKFPELKNGKYILDDRNVSKAARDKKIIQLASLGVSGIKIAQQLKCSEATVSRVINNLSHGVRPPMK